MNKKAIIIVLDSVGIGELPDAANYGDKGADTLGHIINTCHPNLPHMSASSARPGGECSATSPIPAPR